MVILSTSGGFLFNRRDFLVVEGIFEEHESILWEGNIDLLYLNLQGGAS